MRDGPILQVVHSDWVNDEIIWFVMQNDWLSAWRFVSSLLVRYFVANLRKVLLRHINSSVRKT